MNKDFIKGIVIGLGAIGVGAAIKKPNKKRNPTLDIPEGEIVYVYRIQNEKGVGPYTGKDSIYEKGFKELENPNAFKQLIMGSKKINKAMIALIDSFSREDFGEGVFRISMKNDDFEHSDHTFARKQKALSGFLDIEQFRSWFPFDEELKYLAEHGFELYKIPAKAVRYTDSQVLFVPAGKGEKVTDLSPEDKEFLKETRENLTDFVAMALDGLQKMGKKGKI